MTNEVDLVLVNPASSTKVYQELTSLRAIEPPFWAGLIASFIRGHGYEVRIVDAENWSPEQTAEKVAEYAPRLVAIIVQGANPSASSTPKMSAASDLLKELRRKAPDTCIIIGGLHPSALPERTLREEQVDFVSEGEGFYTILGILEWFRAGKARDNLHIPGLHYRDGDKIVLNPRAKLLPSSELPPIAWDLLDMTKYQAHNWHCLDNIDQRSPYGVIYSSLGCPYYCYYCNIHVLYKGNKPSIRFRPPEKVIEEIDLLVNKYGVRNIKFMDELFTINEKQVASICDSIINRGYDLNIWAYTKVDLVTKPMLTKMKQAGINWLCPGIEAGSEQVRQGMGKGFSQDTIRKAVEMMREVGIHIIANFIFGLPDDDRESMQATLNMAEEYNFEYVNFYPCLAYPGSQLYQDALRQGVRLPETWDGYAPLGYDTLPLSTKYLSSEEVLAFRDMAFKEYFSRPEYLEMVRSKFGDKAVEHIKEMLRHKIQRKLLGN